MKTPVIESHTHIHQPPEPEPLYVTAKELSKRMGAGFSVDSIREMVSHPSGEWGLVAEKHWIIRGGKRLYYLPQIKKDFTPKGATV